MSDDTLTPQYTQAQLDEFNAELENKSPQDVLKWAIDNIDGLYQTTAFGLYAPLESFLTAAPA